MGGVFVIDDDVVFVRHMNRDEFNIVKKRVKEDSKDRFIYNFYGRVVYKHPCIVWSMFPPGGNITAVMRGDNSVIKFAEWLEESVGLTYQKSWYESYVEE